MALLDNQRVIFHHLRGKKESSIHHSKCSELWKWQQAMEMAATGLMSIRKVAQCNNVPFTTLHNRVSGRVIHNVNSGPVRYLNAEKENTLTTF